MASKLLAGLGLSSIVKMEQISSDTILRIVSNLNILEIVVLCVFGSVLIDRIMLQGWKEKIPFYLIKCPHHGYQLSYPSGFEQNLICPRCLSK
jgi:hypothetical protein